MKLTSIDDLWMRPFKGPTNPVKSTWQLTRRLQRPGLSARAYHCRELQNALPKGTCMGHKTAVEHSLQLVQSNDSVTPSKRAWQFGLCKC